jgi:hypothetical protein
LDTLLLLLLLLLLPPGSLLVIDSCCCCCCCCAIWGTFCSRVSNIALWLETMFTYDSKAGSPAKVQLQCAVCLFALCACLLYELTAGITNCHQSS